MVTTHLKSQGNRYNVIFQVGALGLLLFALLRLALLLRMWSEIDHHLLELLYIFGIGSVYDGAFLSYVSIPFVLFLLVLPKKWFNSTAFKISTQTAIFIIIFGLLFSLVAEWLFWDEFGVRLNFIAVDYLVYRREVTDNIIQSYPLPWILTNIFFAASMTFIMLRRFLLSTPYCSESFTQRLYKAISILLIPGAAYLFMGQSQHDFSNNNYVNELASNGLYQLFAAFRNNKLDYQQFYTQGNDAELSDILKRNVQGPESSVNNKDLYNIARHVESKQKEKQLNVILISVESLSAEFLTRFGEKEGATTFQESITPFMDKWLPEGLLFTRFYATGTRTVRGLEAITLSIPPTPGRSTVKRPDNSRMYSLGKVFKDKNYDVAYLYGGRGYFDNMNTFFSGNGYRIVDQTDLSKEEIHFKNAWGVEDEDLYQRTLREANQSQQKGRSFFFHVMTTSNHRPFTYREGAIDIASGTGRAGGVKYTDYALGEFIKEAKTQSWFDDTMFVVVADHCAGSAGKVGLPVEKYHIPLFVYAPKHVKPGEIDKLASQIDLAPTILSLLNFSYDSFFFGRDILSPTFKGRALIANYQKLGLFNGNELLILSPRKEIDLVKTETNGPITRKVKVTYPMVNELMSFYQGANFILENRLNRWKETQLSYAFR